LRECPPQPRPATASCSGRGACASRVAAEVRERSVQTANRGARLRGNDRKGRYRWRGGDGCRGGGRVFRCWSPGLARVGTHRPLSHAARLPVRSPHLRPRSAIARQAAAGGRPCTASTSSTTESPAARAPVRTWSIPRRCKVGGAAPVAAAMAPLSRRAVPPSGSSASQSSSSASQTASSRAVAQGWPSGLERQGLLTERR
jgi:hypothetical protein